VLGAEIPLLWNLAWPLLGGQSGQPDGGFYWQSQPNLLDPVLVNRAMGHPVDENGYSDHFPIGVRVTESD